MTAVAPGIRPGTVILGAGASSRMGEPKLLLRWGSASIVEHLLNLWDSLGVEQLAVVCAPEPHPLHRELDRLAFPQGSRILNPSPEMGMFSSVQAAARWPGWNANLTHFAIALGDQPQIDRATLGTLLAHAWKNPGRICQLSFHRRPTHPIVFPKSWFEQLAVTREATLRDFLEKHPERRAFCEIPEEALTVDLDTPENYREAVRRFL